MTIASIPPTQSNPTEQRFYTPEEYLAFEAAAKERHEYRNGEMIPMAGGTTNHNTIAGNLFAFAKYGLRGKGYRTFISDVKLWTPEPPKFTYPDVMLVKGEPEYYGEGTSVITNPQVIIEVLSESTQAHDQSKKFRYYRSAPSFQEYILISQYDFYAEQYVRTESGQWLMSEYAAAEAVLELATVELAIPFSDLYEDVQFEPASTETVAD